MKLREKTILPVISIVTGAMALLTLITIQLSRGEIERLVQGRIQSEVNNLHSSLEIYQSNSLTQVEDWGYAPQISQALEGSSDYGPVSQRFVDIKTRNPQYQLIALYDLDGQTLAASDPSAMSIAIPDRAYFQRARAGELHLSDAIVSRLNGAPATVAASPVRLNGSVQAVLIAVIDLSYFEQEYIKPVQVGTSGYAYLVQPNGIAISHPNRDMIMNPELSIGGLEFFQTMAGQKDGYIRYVYNGVSKQVAFRSVAPHGWILGVTADDDDVYAELNELMILSIVLGAALLGLLALVIWFTIDHLIRRIRKEIALAETIAQGDLRSEVDESNLKSKDELGDLTRSLAAMRDQLAKTVGTIRDAAHRMVQGSEEINETTKIVSESANGQAAAVEEVSASMEEIASMVKDNSAHAHETHSVSAETVEKMEAGQQSFEQTIVGLKEIATSIQVVEEIARQTDLLALNAAIEAARAGEQGKGFAVVASEVRKLAERSGKSAGEILELSKNRSAVANRAKEYLEQLVPLLDKSAGLVEQIERASDQQTRGINEVHSAIGSLDGTIQQNAASAEELSAMAQDLEEQARHLEESVAYFKL